MKKEQNGVGEVGGSEGGGGVEGGEGCAAVCLSGAFWIKHVHTDAVKQEIEGNQTLVDWLVVSAGFDFDPDSREGLQKRGGEAGGRDRKGKET